MASKKENEKEIKELFEDLAPGAVAGVKIILDKISELGLNPADIIDSGYITLRKFNKLSAEQQNLIKNPPKPSSEPNTFFGEWDKMTNMEKKDFSLSLIEDNFIRAGLKTDRGLQGFSYFSITDKSVKSCSVMPSDTRKQKTKIESLIAGKLLANHLCAKPSVISDIFQWIDYYIQPSPDVLHTKSVYNTDDSWTLYYSPYEADITVPFPNIKATLDRMSEGAAFAAWVWGVYTGRYKGRQIFWVVGEEGEEGKSYLGKFLGTHLFGEDCGYKSVSNEQIVGKSSFILGSFVGAKLLIYPDCNSVHALKSEKMKGLSGGGRDSTYTDRKYKDAQTVTIDARLVIFSNKFPSVIRDNWYLSRLALCTISPLKTPLDPNIDKKYLPELPGFLNYAKECYEALCINDESIKLTPETLKKIKELQDIEDPLEQDLFDRYFEFNVSESIKLSVVVDRLLLENQNKDQQKKFLSFLETKGVKHGRTNGSQMLRGMKLKSLSMVKSTPGSGEMKSTIFGKTL